MTSTIERRCRAGLPNLLRVWLVAVCCTAGLWLTVACSRKAPGPFECRKFATRVLGITDPQALRSKRVRLAVESVTTECITTPYDRALLRCVETGAAPESCLLEFRTRNPAAYQRLIDKRRPR